MITLLEPHPMVRLFLREFTAIPFVKIYAKSKKAESAVAI